MPRKILRWCGSLLTTLLLILAVVFSGLVAVIPRVMGGESRTVLTQSMEPVLHPGDLIAVVPRPCSQIGIGDVITYMPNPQDPTTITHRVYSKSMGGSRGCDLGVKGDNNDDPDRTIVHKDMIVGKVIYSLPKLGWAAQSLGQHRNKIIYSIAGGAFLLALLFLFLPDKTRETEEAGEAPSATNTHRK